MGYFKHAKALVARGVKIGDGTRIWAFVNVQAGALIGANCNICDCSFIEKGSVIGNDVTIKNGVSIYEGVTLEDGVFVGPNATFVNDRYPRSRRGWTMEPIRVKKGASIGANATILCGITIGEGALIGAGSVVVKDVPAYTVVAGNPARTIGRVSAEGKPVDRSLKGRRHV